MSNQQSSVQENLDFNNSCGSQISIMSTQSCQYNPPMFDQRKAKLNELDYSDLSASMNSGTTTEHLNNSDEFAVSINNTGVTSKMYPSTVNLFNVSAAHQQNVNVY